MLLAADHTLLAECDLLAPAEFSVVFATVLRRQLDVVALHCLHQQSCSISDQLSSQADIQSVWVNCVMLYNQHPRPTQPGHPCLCSE